MESFWDRMMDGLRDIGTAIGDWTPKVIGALVILIVGWLIARILRNFVRRLLELAPVKAVLKAAGIENALEGSGYEASKLGASIVYFYLWLVVLLLAFEALQAQTIVDLLERMLAVIPLIFVAFVILVLAAAVGRFVAGLVGPWAESHGVTWLPWITQGGFILFGLVTAFQILDIGFFTEALTAGIFGGVGIAFAIAFGVGGIDTARKWWAKYLSPSEGRPQRDTTP